MPQAWASRKRTGSGCGLRPRRPATAPSEASVARCSATASGPSSRRRRDWRVWAPLRSLTGATLAASNPESPCSGTSMRRLTLVLVLLAFAAVPATADAAKRGRCLMRSDGPTCFIWSGKVTFVADGDTVYVDIDGDGTRHAYPVRVTGINAMEQTTYTTRASQRRGECHALEATARLDQLLKASKYRVRLLAIDPASTSGRRLRRSLAVRSHGRWRDVGRTLVAEGNALWLANGREWAWNRDYRVLQDRAQRAGRNL